MLVQVEILWLPSPGSSPPGWGNGKRWKPGDTSTEGKADFASFLEELSMRVAKGTKRNLKIL